MVEIKNKWIYTSAFPYAFMACRGAIFLSPRAYTKTFRGQKVTFGNK